MSKYPEDFDFNQDPTSAGTFPDTIDIPIDDSFDMDANIDQGIADLDTNSTT